MESTKVEIEVAILEGMQHYLRALHEQGAVDNLKMKYASYKSLRECMDLWGIEPYWSYNLPKAEEPPYCPRCGYPCMRCNGGR